MDNRPIGIFDSGIGGLTVLRQIQRLLPGEDVVYFGDTARVPYGGKSKSTIIKFSTENIIFLLEKNVKLVIVACNTSSALAISYLQKVFSVPILGVIEAGINKALEVSLNKKIAVIGTRSTIESGAYQGRIMKKNKKAKVYSKSCPLFVPLVEEGILSGKLVQEAIQMYLKGIKKENIDSIILGCTHYPLLKNEIASYLKGINIVDSAKEVAQHTQSILEINDLLSNNHNAKESYYVSDDPEGFRKLAKLLLKKAIPKPKRVNV